MRNGAQEWSSAPGSAPVIRYFDLQMLLDNEAGTTTEWSKSGEKSVRQVP
jgi:hypothetical protein